jgi:hypothetical protein
MIEDGYRWIQQAFFVFIVQPDSGIQISRIGALLIQIRVGGWTDAGLQREQKLRSELRKEYVTRWKLLPEQYKAKALYVRSTDFSNTKGTDRRGNVRYDAHCKKHKLAIRAQNAGKLRLVQPKSAPNKKINLQSYKFIEVINPPGTYLPNSRFWDLTRFKVDPGFTRSILKKF